MADFHYEPTTVNITSYDTFKADVNGNGWDCDGLYGAQCVDAFMLLNYNLGYSSPYAWSGSNDAKGMWTDPISRARNASDKYDLIYNLSDVKRGDMIIVDIWTTGHNAFADEDYTGQTYLNCLGQNQYGVSFPTGGACFNIYPISTSNFLGAFRLKQWHSQGGGVARKHAKQKFPFVLYAKKFRNARSM